jgi:hypothetical protein
MLQQHLFLQTDIEAKFNQGENKSEDMIAEAYAALLLAFLSGER